MINKFTTVYAGSIRANRRALLKLGSWLAGTPDDLVGNLKSFEEHYPGMQHINLSPPLTTPKNRSSISTGWSASW